MLITTRRVGETIISAGLGSVTVTAAKGKRVRLGTVAPNVPKPLPTTAASVGAQRSCHSSAHIRLGPLQVPHTGQHVDALGIVDLHQLSDGGSVVPLLVLR